MNMVANAEASPENFISYEELTTLALDSAIALENLIQHQPTDTSPVDKLFVILNESPGLGVGSGRAQHISPTALAVYSRTLRQTGENISTLDDIVTRIISVTNNFDKDKPSTPFKNLRDFCLALHEELLNETIGVENNNNWEERERGTAIKLC